MKRQREPRRKGVIRLYASGRKVGRSSQAETRRYKIFVIKSHMKSEWRPSEIEHIGFVIAHSQFAAESKFRHDHSALLSPTTRLVAAVVPA